MNDINGFDLDRTTQQAWDAFTKRLAEVLSVMDDSSDLTLSVTCGTEFEPTLSYCAIAPGVIQASLHCSEQPQRLTDLGWEPHESGCFISRADQENTMELAQRSVTTLTRALDVLHPVFLEPNQLGEILTPGGEPPLEEPQATEQHAVLVPTSKAQLDSMVEGVLTEINGYPPLRNAQGDLAIRVGSAVVFLRVPQDFNEVVLFSPLVHDVAGRSRAAEVLNDLNMEARYCRFALHKDRVFAQISVLARPFIPAHLKTALEHLTNIADGIDDELAARLHGRTTYPS